jgi:hypothetical protein
MKSETNEKALYVDKKMTINGQTFDVTLVFKPPEKSSETVEDKIKHLINGDKIGRKKSGLSSRIVIYCGCILFGLIPEVNSSGQEDI